MLKFIVQGLFLLVSRDQMSTVIIGNTREDKYVHREEFRNKKEDNLTIISLHINDFYKEWLKKEWSAAKLPSSNFSWVNKIIRNKY